MKVVKLAAKPAPAAHEGDAQVTYQVLQIPLARIRAFAFQPRKWFDPEEIYARAESMKALGQQDPVTVERVSGDPDHDFELINGESRLRSARKAGIKTLWAAVRSWPFESRASKHMASLVANFNRSDHTPMEISDALFVQATEGGKTQREIACAIGKPEMWVSQFLSLQKLHPDIQALLHPTVHKDRRIAPGVGFEIAKIAPAARQLEVMEAARGADGRVTKLRVQIEADRTLGKKTRQQSPSKRREKIANTVRAIRLDLAKLHAAVGMDAKEAMRLLRHDGARGPNVIEEGIDTLQSVKAAISRQEKSGVAAPKLMDTTRMSAEERAAYVEAWRQYWLTFPAPSPAKPEPLLLGFAYPQRIRTPPQAIRRQA